MTEGRVSASLRRLVAERARRTCEYCRSPERYGTQALSVEHIIPRSEGGENVPDNLAYSCQGCNNHKYTNTTGRDPITGNLAPLFHPRQHRWKDHFAWNADCSLIIGLSPTGRATVEELHLNREGVVNLRRMLFAANQHPPKEPNDA